MAVFDHVVVGAGIVGSCAALQLAKLGKKVLLLDQFSLPHTRGSSHGPSRMIRSCYSETFFARIMPTAFAMWRELERESGTTLLETTGVLCISNKTQGRDVFEKARSNMLDINPQHYEPLQEGELQSRYPMLKFDADYEAFIDKSGGAIYANKALTAVQDLFKAIGGQLWDACSVAGILPGSDVTVVTSRGDVTCKTVVVCAGAWTEQLLRKSLGVQLPLKAEAVKVYYWKELNVGTHTSKAGLKPFKDYSSHPWSIYGFPSGEYPGLVKVSAHGGSDCDPDARERAQHRPELQDALARYVEDHLPGLETEPAIVENCMYTLTPDEVFIVDTLPNHKSIIVGSGFSGTGFKTAPVIGKALAELATGASPSIDISSFGLSRFEDK